MCFPENTTATLIPAGGGARDQGARGAVSAAKVRMMGGRISGFPEATYSTTHTCLLAAVQGPATGAAASTLPRYPKRHSLATPACLLTQFEALSMEATPGPTTHQAQQGSRTATAAAAAGGVGTPFQPPCRTRVSFGAASVHCYTPEPQQQGKGQEPEQADAAATCGASADLDTPTRSTAGHTPHVSRSSRGQLMGTDAQVAPINWEDGSKDTTPAATTTAAAAAALQEVQEEEEDESSCLNNAAAEGSGSPQADTPADSPPPAAAAAPAAIELLTPTQPPAAAAATDGATPLNTPSFCPSRLFTPIGEACCPGLCRQAFHRSACTVESADQYNKPQAVVNTMQHAAGMCSMRRHLKWAPSQDCTRKSPSTLGHQCSCPSCSFFHDLSTCTPPNHLSDCSQVRRQGQQQCAAPAGACAHDPCCQPAGCFQGGALPPGRPRRTGSPGGRSCWQHHRRRCCCYWGDVPAGRQWCRCGAWGHAARALPAAEPCAGQAQGPGATGGSWAGEFGVGCAEQHSMAGSDAAAGAAGKYRAETRTTINLRARVLLWG